MTIGNKPDWIASSSRELLLAMTETKKPPAHFISN